MSPISTKAELVKKVFTSRRKLDRKVQHLKREELIKPSTVGEGSFKDMLAHLADWEERFLSWVEAEDCGQTAQPPEPGFSFADKDLAEVNRRIYEAHRDLPLEGALDYFHSAHQKFVEWLEVAPEEDLFTPGRYKFTGQGNLARWVLHYARHDDWGSEMINQYHKGLQTPDKAKVIQQLRDSRAKLEKLIAKLTPEEIVLPGVVNEWSAKDVLAHLADWQERHIGWQTAMARGEVPATPAPGFTWKTADMDRLNRIIYETHCHQSLEEVLDYFRSTFDRFMEQVEAVPEEKMFAPAGFNFIGKGTPAKWFRDYAWHDGWGISKIDKCHRERSKKP